VCEPSDRVEDADLFAGVPDAFQRLWTPHRMAYIGGESKPVGPDEPDCPFCRAPRHSDEGSLIVARGELAYVVMNLYPYSPGHLLVCPYRHVAEYVDASLGEVDEIARLTRIAIRTLSRVSHPQGFNIGMNQGAVGGAGIRAHLHQHVVPRWLGDTNFLPIVAQTRAVPQLLSSGREQLAEAWGVAAAEEDERERHA